MVASSSEAVGDDEPAHRVCSSDDILSKILIGLPLNSLHVCKSVCKRWFSLINDPCFNSLRSRSPNTHHPCALLLQLEQASSEFACVPLKSSSDSPPSITTRIVPFYPKKSAYIQVLQSCNGLLLCYDRPTKFYVYNPIINYRKLIPLLPRIWKPDPVFTYMGLAFDPAVSPHYKLVYAREDSNGRVHVEIYYSKTGLWGTCAQTFSPSSFTMFRVRLVYWRGAIHWLSRHHVYHFNVDDIRNPRFIQFENNKNLNGVTHYLGDKLLVSPPRDCLLLAKILPPQQMKVYEMNDYSTGWCIKYHVNLDSAIESFPGPIFRVLSVVVKDKEEDSFIVLEVPENAIIQYNIVSKTFRRLCDLTQIQIRGAAYCHFEFTPSLVG